MKKKIILSVAILLIILFGLYQYAYKAQRNISDEKATFETTVSQITSEFASDETSANKKYLDQTISIYGKITNIDLETSSIVIDNKIYVTFTEKIIAKIAVNQQVTIKGRFIGYDDLLEEFRIDQASLLN